MSTYKKLEGIIKTVTHFDPESGAIVLKIAPHSSSQIPSDAALRTQGASKDNAVTALGNLAISSEKSDVKDLEVTMTGYWKFNMKYQGKQFHFTDCKLNDDGLYYFLAKVTKGFGPKLAKLLLDKYSENELEEIIETNPEKLLSVGGIGKKRLTKIQSSWLQFKSLKELTKFLGKYGVSTGLIKRIHKYAEDSNKIIKDIKENPYIISNMPGVGFKTADLLARKLEFPVMSPKRIEAAIEYFFKDFAESSGHSRLNIKELYETVREHLTFEALDKKEFHLEYEFFYKCLKGLIDHQRVVLFKGTDPEGNDDSVALAELYFTEKNILSFIEAKKKIKNPVVHNNIEQYIKEKEEEMGFGFSDQQKDAIKMVNSGITLFALCGYAGTGKSTIAKAILDLVSKNKKVLCCALSGMASGRIAKTSGYESKTISSLVMAAEKEKKKIEVDVLLIDEASMVNSKLMNQLFKVIDEKTIVIIVGDTAQLPPIGAGDPFSNFIKYSLIPSVELTKIYRQSDDKVITKFAFDIRNSKVPKDYMKQYEDFSFVNISVEKYFKKVKWLEKEPKDEEERLLQKEHSQTFEIEKEQNRKKIRNSIAHILLSKKEVVETYKDNQKWSDYVSEIQMISPMKGGILGTDMLNYIGQKIFNPSFADLFEKKKKTIKENLIRAGRAIESITDQELNQEAGRIPLNEYERKKRYEPIAKVSDKEFRKYDKVIHKKNINMITIERKVFKDRHNKEHHQEQRVLNGMIGIIVEIDKNPQYENQNIVWIFYPAENMVVPYSNDDIIRFIDLAYCLTIHKTQGSEYKEVVMPITYSHFKMLSTKLLYTGITRGKEKVHVAGEFYAFESACRIREEDIRKTVIDVLVAA